MALYNSARVRTFRVWSFFVMCTVVLLYNLNVIQLQLVSTGAFEISVDSMPLWSKIESGRIPQPPELFQILDNHFKMNAGHDNYLNPGMITK